MAGALDSRIDETPIAIIDFETTCLTPRYDRVLEISVVRKDPGQAPRLVFDTLSIHADAWRRLPCKRHCIGSLNLRASDASEGIG